MTREILEPRWANDSKTKVHCVFKYDDGRVLKAIVQDTEEGNPDWKEIFDTYSNEDIENNTKKFFDRIEEDRNNQVQRDKERAETMKNEAIFNAKLEAFTIEEIRNSKNTQLKSKIRRAKNLLEVSAYTALLLMKEESVNPEIPKEEEVKPKRKSRKTAEWKKVLLL